MHIRIIQLHRLNKIQQQQQTSILDKSLQFRVPMVFDWAQLFFKIVKKIIYVFQMIQQVNQAMVLVNMKPHIQTIQLFLIGMSGQFEEYSDIKPFCLILLMKISKMAKQAQSHDKQVLSTQPSSPSSLYIRYMTKIPIPLTSSKDNQKEDLTNKLPNKLPQGKTNLKQLYNFLKNQVIVVRHKERLVSNRNCFDRFGSISQLNRPITKAVCLKIDQSANHSSLEHNIRTICLPRIERQSYPRQFIESQVEQEQADRQTNQRNKTKKMHNKNGKLRRVGTEGRVSSIDGSPLISLASRHISIQKKYGSRSRKWESMASPHLQTDVVDFSLYRQCPQLNRISINLAVGVSRCSTHKTCHE